MLPDVLGLSFSRAMMVGDNDEAAEYARRMIETGEHWRSAVLYLVQNAVVSDDAWETITFLDKHIPGFSDLGNLNVPFDVHAIRFAYLDVFREIKGEDEVISIHCWIRLSLQEVWASLSKTVLLYTSTCSPFEEKPRPRSN